MNKTYPTHELARLLPPMTDEDYQRLRQDIKENGLLEPITLHEGKVLDGIHRQRACKEVKVEPRYVTYDGDDPARSVFSHNLARRHLSVGQLAAVGAELVPRFAVEAGKRKTAGVANDLGLNSGQGPGRAAGQVAELLGIGRDSIEKATKIKKERPDLASEVKTGKRSLNSAYEETTGKPTSYTSGRRSKNWNGKTTPTRNRELKAQKNGDYAELLRLSLEMNRMCNIIEAYKPEEFELDTETVVLIDDFYDDLVTLATWVDRALMATQGWLDDVKVRRVIAALRDTTGRLPEEIPAYLKRADDLERKLELRLERGAT